MRKGIAVLALATGLACAASADGLRMLALADVPEGRGNGGRRLEIVDLGDLGDPVSVKRAAIDLPDLPKDEGSSDWRARLYGERLVALSRVGGSASAKDELRVYQVRPDLSLKLERKLPLFDAPELREALKGQPFERVKVLFFPSRIWVIATCSGDGLMAAAWRVDAAGLVSPVPRQELGPAQAIALAGDKRRFRLLPLVVEAARGDELVVTKGFASLEALLAERGIVGDYRASVKARDRAALVGLGDGSASILLDLAGGGRREVAPAGDGDRSLLLQDSYFELGWSSRWDIAGKSHLACVANSTLYVYDMEYPLYPRRIAYTYLPGEGESRWRMAGIFDGGFLLASPGGSLLPYVIGADGSCAPAWDGPALLKVAIARGDVSRAKALCEAGIDPTAPDAEGRPTWLTAVAADKPAVLEALLGLMEAAAAENERDRDGPPRFWAEAGPVSYALSLGKGKMALDLATRWPAGLRSGGDRDALFLAAERGDAELCGALIDAGADPATRFRVGPSYGDALAYAKDADTKAYLIRRGVPETIVLEKPEPLYGQVEGLALRAAPSAQAAVVARGGVDFEDNSFALLASRATLESVEGRICRWIKVRAGGKEGWAPSFRFMHAYDDGP